MIIILEGPDGAGKSALAKRLYTWLAGDDDTTTVHHGPYKGIEANELAKLYFASMSQALTHNKHVILDRSWYSEPIYAAVHRKQPSRITTTYRRMLERAALSRGALIIKCLPSFEACLESFNSRPEYLGNTAELEEVYRKYSKWGESFIGVPSIDYNYETMRVEDIIDKIIAHDSSNPYGGGGAFQTGNVLVLCSKWRVANVKPSAVVIPYVNFNEDVSETPSASKVITDELENLGLPESSIYWVNVESTAGVVLSTQIIAELQPSRIIAIGAQPLQWCKANGVEAQCVTHPNKNKPFSLQVT